MKKKILSSIVCAICGISFVFAVAYPVGTCTKNGEFLLHQYNKGLYYQCKQGLFGSFVLELKECPPGKQFNLVTSACDLPFNIDD